MFRFISFLLLFLGFASGCNPVLAQISLEDDFSDGNFTSSLPWLGDTSKFDVNAALQLQLNDPVAASGEAYLAINSTISNKARWEFYVDLGFNPSTSNFCKVYLTSSSQNLKAALNGYYVQIGGQSGAVDDVSLYRQNGNSSSLIIDGVDGTVANNPKVRITVSRDSTSKWELLIDTSLRLNHPISQGTAVDNTFDQSSYFGVFCKYTSSRTDKFFFDDIKLNGEAFQDTSKPKIVGVQTLGSKQLNVSFNEYIDTLSALNTLNYSVNNNIGNPSSVQINPGDSSIVELSFPVDFVSGEDYQLITKNVGDRNGNFLLVDTSLFSYFVSIPAKKRDLVINELYPDFNPSIQLPEAEFIELYNASKTVFDLVGWQLSDGTSTATLSHQILKPNEYLIICSESADSAFQKLGSTQAVSNFPSLNNSGDNIQLFDDNNLLIDEVSYTIEWYKNADKDGGGYSLEQINPFTQCTGVNNFSASNSSSGGTPGTQNSILDTLPDLVPPKLLDAKVLTSDRVLLEFDEFLDSNSVLTARYVFNTAVAIGQVLNQPSEYQKVLLILDSPLDSGVINTLTVNHLKDCSGNTISGDNQIDLVVPGIPNYRDIVINEFFADPNPSVGLPDAEFIELFNASQKIFDLEGWTVGDASTVSTLSSLIFMPGDYVIVCSEGSEAAFQGFGEVQGQRSFASLNNSADHLLLKDKKGNLIDEVFYTDEWYKDNVKKEGGYSLEQKNPFTNCSGANNFIASNNSLGGTPGQKNSAFDTLPDLVSPHLLGGTILSPNRVLLEFDEYLDSNSVKSASYKLSNSIAVQEIVNRPPLYQSIELVLSSSIDTGVVVHFSVSNLKDCSGNLIDSSEQIELLISKIPAYRDIVINEFLANPSPKVGLPEAEFIELYNASDNIYDLKGWKLGDQTTLSTLSTFLFKPGDYLIVCKEENATAFSTFGPTQGQIDFPSIHNSNDELLLRDNQNQLIDFISYTDQWYMSLVKQQGGYSLEQINPNKACSGSNNFIASKSSIGGTPGQINSVFDSTPDQDPPNLINAFVLAADSLQLRFDESLDTNSASMANYTFSTGNRVSKIQNVGPEFNAVILVLSNPLKVGEMVKLNIENLADCSGNFLESSSTTLALAQETNFNDVVINEVLFNPRSGGVDFVELYNRSDKILSLENWQMANFDDDSIANKKTITSEPLLFFPKEYVVLTESTANILQEYPSSRTDRFVEVDQLPSYNDDEGVVYLFDKTTLLDKVSYSESQHFALLKDVEGVSLERVNSERPSDDPTNFHSAAQAVGFATPAYQNSQFFAETKFNGAITIEPGTFSPDNDGFQDIVNINYQFDAPGFIANVTIFDRNGRLIRSLVQNELLGKQGTFSWDGISNDNNKARIGIYVVFFEALTTSGKQEVFKKTVVVAGRL